VAKFQAIVRGFALFSIMLLPPPSGQTAERTQTTIWGGPSFSLGKYWPFWTMQRLPVSSSLQ